MSCERTAVRGGAAPHTETRTGDGGKRSFGGATSECTASNFWFRTVQPPRSNSVMSLGDTERDRERIHRDSHSVSWNRTSTTRLLRCLSLRRIAETAHGVRRWVFGRHDQGCGTTAATICVAHGGDGLCFRPMATMERGVDGLARWGTRRPAPGLARLARHMALRQPAAYFGPVQVSGSLWESLGACCAPRMDGWRELAERPVCDLRV